MGKRQVMDGAARRIEMRPAVQYNRGRSTAKTYGRTNWGAYWCICWRTGWRIGWRIGGGACGGR